jgi:sodium transport system permease protein
VRLADVGVVAVKELRETLRDRRTLAVMFLFPLVVYPLMTLLMAQGITSEVARRRAITSRVAVAGPAAAAEPVRALLAARGKPHFTFVPLPPGMTPADAVRAGTVDAVAEVLPGASPPTRVRLVYDDKREASSDARDGLSGVLGGERPARCDTLFAVEDQNLAPHPPPGTDILAKLLPIVVVVMTLLGAFHPAIDITAGERERGTLETILCAPVRRFDLMAGKVLAVATIAIVTGLLNMGSLSLTTLEGEHLVGRALPFAIPWGRAAMMLIALVPAAFLFASIMVAIGAMARSYKEAQTLLTPVYVLCFIPAMVATSAGWKLAGPAALVPGVNVTLLSRDLILGDATVGLTLVIVASTLAWCALALSLAARLYDSERLLTADDGTLGLFAWLRRLVSLGDGDDEARATAASPSTPGQALALFAVAYVLLFFVFIPLQAWRLAPGILLTEWAGILGLVVVYARGSRQRLFDVLRVRRVPPRALAGAALVGLSAWMVVGLLAQWLVPAPKELVESLRRMVAPEGAGRGLVASLGLIALTPAICEEALFRGPILRGFSAKLPRVTSAVLTGLLFGLYHVDLWRLLPTATLGVILSLIALECDSIVPAMLTHFINNACLVALTYAGKGGDPDELGRPAQAALFVGALVVLLAGAAMLRNRGPRDRTL